MKLGIHPVYRKVVFHDTSVDKYYLVGSTLKTDRTIEWQDGNTYPYVTLDVSSASHPFFTGTHREVDKEGAVANFNRRFGRFTKKP